jgi:diguanylate cyclase (GGDEF)-like protein/PAS domain S-box-containing protein
MSRTPQPAGPAAEIDAEAERQKTTLLYRNAGVAQLLNLVNATLFAYVNATLDSPVRVAFAWWCLLAAVVAGRYLLARRFLAVRPDADQAVAWRRRYIAATALLAATWGVGSALFMWQASDAAFLFTGLVLTGMVAGAVPILSPVPGAYRAFALLVLVPMAAITLIQADTPLHWAFGALTIIFLAALLVGARNLHETLDVAIRLGLEQGRLAEHLEHALAQRRHAEGKLHLAASVFANSQEGIIITATDGTIVDINHAFTEITGYPPEEAIGQTARLLRSAHHDPTFFATMWEDLARTGAWRGEIWNRRKDGGEYPAWLSIASVPDQTGAVTHYVGTLTDISQRKSAEEEIRHLAFYDPLTGLPNRRLLTDRLNHARQTGARRGRMGALLFIDLDNFKTLNDTLGHDKGDLLLEQVAGRLTGCVRESDTVARFGGDEFVVMLEGLVGQTDDAAGQARAVGEKILATLNQPYLLAGHEHQGTCSIGATLFSGRGDSVEELLKQADLAMYRAKEAGRNVLRFFDQSMQDVVAARVALEADLRQALNRNEFELHYQPQVDRAGRMTGAEVLLRWRHPERGMVSPADFIPVAEETGMILDIGRWVLNSACARLAAWASHPERARCTLAVNISARQFRQADFAQQVLATLYRTGANPHRLKLELTESLLLDDMEDAIARMASLKQYGVGFALDDFGTGYSSLSYLKRLPLDQLKIDQSFVREVLSDPNDAAIARTIVALAHSLGLAVIAEGVETEAQRDFLDGAGCHAYQGYLYGRPEVAEAIELRLDREPSYA